MASLNLTRQQFQMLRAVARNGNLGVDADTVAELHELGLVEINVPGEQLISVTKRGLKWLAKHPKGSSNTYR